MYEMDDGFIMAAEEKMRSDGITRKELAERCGFVTELIERVMDEKIPLRLDVAAAMAASIGISLDETCGIIKITGRME